MHSAPKPPKLQLPEMHDKGDEQWLSVKHAAPTPPHIWPLHCRGGVHQLDASHDTPSRRPSNAQLPEMHKKGDVQ